MRNGPDVEKTVWKSRPMTRNSANRTSSVSRASNANTCADGLRTLGRHWVAAAVAVSVPLIGCTSPAVVGAQPGVSQGGRAISIAVEPGSDSHHPSHSLDRRMCRADDGPRPQPHWTSCRDARSVAVRDARRSVGHGLTIDLDRTLGPDRRLFDGIPKWLPSTELI